MELLDHRDAGGVPRASGPVFIQEEEVVRTGVSYLRIMGYSQILMCLEITSSGAFQGLGPIP